MRNRNGFYRVLNAVYLVVTLIIWVVIHTPPEVCVIGVYV